MQYTTLISPAQLRAHLIHPDWRVFDCRFRLDDAQAGQRAYATGHIAGATYADLERHLSGAVSAQTGRHPLPDPDALKAWLGEQGIGHTTQVVVYDDQNGMIAARLWWLLRWLGHTSVALLDGELPRWQAEDGPMSLDAPTPRPTRFNGEPNNDLLVLTADVVAGREGLRMLDVRAPARFRGEHEPLDPVAGHIPGAVNAPLQDSLDEQGNFLAPDTLLARFEPLLRNIRTECVVAMCGSGVTACHTLLALELAGLHGARLYAGSWSEWIRDPHRPIARGSK